MGQSWLRHGLQIVGVALLAGALAAWPAYAWLGTEGLTGLAVAGAICVVGALGGRAVYAVLRGLGDGSQGMAPAIQGGMAARLLLTAALTAPVLLLAPFATKPFVVWLAVHYFAQLVLEVFVSLRELGQNHGPVDDSASSAELPPASPGSEGDDRPRASDDT